MLTLTLKCLWIPTCFANSLKLLVNTAQKHKVFLVFGLWLGCVGSLQNVDTVQEPLFVTVQEPQIVTVHKSYLIISALWIVMASLRTAVTSRRTKNFLSWAHVRPVADLSALVAATKLAECVKVWSCHFLSSVISSSAFYVYWIRSWSFAVSFLYVFEAHCAHLLLCLSLLLLLWLFHFLVPF